jgi:group I intron endonuclease
MRKQKICGIYRIISLSHPNRCYIGSAVIINDRWRQHKHLLKNNKHHSVILQRHCNKYGIEDLIFEVIEQFDFISKEHLLEREQFYLDTTNPYFNVNKIAGSTLGYRHTEESILLITEASQKMIRKPHTQETKDLISKNSGVKGKPAWNRGISPKPESIAKRVAHTDYKPPTKETRAKISEKLKGVPKKKESIEKRTKSREGWTFPEKSKKLVSDSLKQGFIDHPEWGEAISERQLGRKQSQITIDKRISKTKGKKISISEEERHRRSEQMKKNCLGRWKNH